MTSPISPIAPELYLVTWTEAGIIGGAAVTILLACIGALWRQISDLGKTVDNNRHEVSRFYATNETVDRVETRLTASVTRLTEQISKDMDRLASRFEAVISAVLSHHGMTEGDK